jgi:[ribosomal protein S5]-alanine N-acetyltransferase
MASSGRCAVPKSANTSEDSYILETPRLILRPMERVDVSALHRIANEPQVRKYLFDDEPVAIDLIEAVLQQSEDNFDSRRFGIWIVRERNSPEAIGLCGLRDAEELGEIEILYALSESKWRLGYATEAALAVQRYSFDHAQLERLIGITDTANHESWRVLERLGMREYRPAKSEPHLRYAVITRSDFVK